jgi:hypothetical protein
MTKIENAVRNMARLRRRSVWPALGIFGFLLAGQNALAAEWHAGNVLAGGLPEQAYPWSTIPAGSSSSETVFVTGTATGALYWGGNDNGTWYFSLIYSNPKAQPLAVSATYFQGLSPALDIYYAAHADADGNVRLSSYTYFNGWTTQLVDTGTTTTVPLPTVATVMFQSKLYLLLLVEWAPGRTQSSELRRDEIQLCSCRSVREHV